MFNLINRFLNGGDITIFHEFHKPPYGGGNQFLMALKKEIEDSGWIVEVNKVSPLTKSVLFNSFNFDFEKLREAKIKSKAVFVHRVDGPIDLYRGEEGGIDRKVWEMNQKVADRTVFQSTFSLTKQLEAGLKYKNVDIIHNAVDSEIFYPGRKKELERKIKLIATSWSDNPKKGGATYKWIEDNLDWDKYEFTFVGRTQIKFEKIKHIEPVVSKKLGDILRDHDIYITASEDDPCSNALIEALSCGLPAVYLESGGHPELVKNGGFGFKTKEKSLEAIEEVARNYKKCQENIRIADMKEVARRYLEVMLG